VILWRWRKEMGLTHWGEYDHVLAKSRDAQRLMRLHEIRCSKTEALALLTWCQSAMQKRRPELLRAFFAGTRGRAGTRVDKHRGVVKYVFVTLPPEGSRRLRVGIVLHEYAHLVAPRGAKHDWRFVTVLDDLCELFESAKLELDVAAGTPVDQTLHRSYTKRVKCVHCKMGTTRKHSVKGYACCGVCERIWR
jgi:hypothetical protein